MLAYAVEVTFVGCRRVTKVFCNERHCEPRDSLQFDIVCDGMQKCCHGWGTKGLMDELGIFARWGCITYMHDIRNVLLGGRWCGFHDGQRRLCSAVVI
jgi:hypothetical protein